MRTLCLGEAIVDLVCERHLPRPADPAQADSFVPHFGGAAANVALVAACSGAEVALAGGAGEDGWGRWLEERLARAGVDLRWWSLVPGLATPVALVGVSEAGEPSFAVYGQGIEATVAALEPRLAEAVEGCDALLFGTNTMAGAPERELTMRARGLALEGSKPVLFDPNLRLHRWPDAERAVVLCRELCEGALLVKANAPEAALITGERDPAAAAEALVALGAEAGLVTRGAEGALLRGTARADVAGVPARVVDATGAGDVLMGVLVAALGRGGYEPAAAAAALPEAVELAARSTESWGAVDGLPSAAGTA